MIGDNRIVLPFCGLFFTFFLHFRKLVVYLHRSFINKRWFKEGWVSGLNQQFAKLPIS